MENSKVLSHDIRSWDENRTWVSPKYRTIIPTSHSLFFCRPFCVLWFMVVTRTDLKQYKCKQFCYTERSLHFKQRRMGTGEKQRENKSDRIMKSCDATWCDRCQCFGRAVCFKPCKARNFDTDARTCTFLCLRQLFSAVGVNTGTKFVGLAPQSLKRDEQCKVERSVTAS